MSQSEFRPVKGLSKVKSDLRISIGRGRDVFQQAEDIRSQGVIFTPYNMRTTVLRGLEVGYEPDAGVVPENPEVVFGVGCADHCEAFALHSTGRLFRKLGIQYSFLEKQLCCGAPLLFQVLTEGQDREAMDGFAREFAETNLMAAGGLGANKLAYACVWCVYLAKRFFADAQVRPMYINDLMVERLEGVPLKLPAKRTVGYFAGCPHRRQVFDPKEIVDYDWTSYRNLLARVEGLELVDIPRYCCSIPNGRRYIIDWAKKRGLDTIVTSCTNCYRMLRFRGVELLYISDILLEAMGQQGAATRDNRFFIEEPVLAGQSPSKLSRGAPC